MKSTLAHLTVGHRPVCSALEHYPHGMVSLSPPGGRMTAILQRLEGPLPTVEPLDRGSRYMKPCCVQYTLDGAAVAVVAMLHR